MLRATTALLAFALAAPAAFAETHQGRGVYYFEGSGRCPLAGVGTRAANACNRLSLEDKESSVVIDVPNHKVTLTNKHSYSSKTLIGDLLFVGTATTAGKPHHIGVHLRIDKKGAAFIAHTHAHVVSWDKVSAPVFEPFDVVVTDGKTSTVVHSHAEATQAVSDPKTAAKIMNELVEVHDVMAKTAAAPGSHLLSAVEVGVGIAGIHKMVARSEFIQHEKPGSHHTLVSLLTSGSWELKITALSGYLPKDAIRHDLFLFGLDKAPQLASVMAKGLADGTVLRLVVKNGKAEIGIGKKLSPFSKGEDVMRNFLEFGFLGTLVKHQAEQHLK